MAPRATAVVFRLAAAFTGLAVAMGGLVCTTRSGAACPTWPGCTTAGITPGWELGPMIEFGHRVVAMGAGPLVLAAALLSLRPTVTDVRVRILPWLALAGAIAAGAFGRLVVLSGLPTWLGAVDLFSALTAMLAMGAAAVLLGSGRRSASGHPIPADLPVRVPADRASRVMRLAGASVVVTVALHVSGLFAAAAGSYTRCLGWPLWQVYPGDLRPWLQQARIGLGVVAAVLVVATVLTGVQAITLRLPAVAVGGLFLAELALGVQVAAPGSHPVAAAAHAVVAVALLSGLGLLATLASVTRAVPVPSAWEGRTVPATASA